MTRKEYAELAAQANAQGKVLQQDDAGSYILVNPSPDEITVSDYESAVDEALKYVANSRGYDSAYTCLSYLNSTNKKWRSEAIVFNSWRDSVWEKCHEILNDVENGKREKPTIEELLHELPTIQW